MSFQIKQGDLGTPLQATLSALGQDLSAATFVEIAFKLRGDINPPTVRTAQILDRKKSIVAYQWLAGDTDLAGEYLVEWRVHRSNGVTTFPNYGFSSFTIVPDLAHTGGPPPLPGPTLVVAGPGLVWRGVYDSHVTYNVNDAVEMVEGASNKFSSFRSTATQQNVPPLDNTGALNSTWERIAQRGADGADGAPASSFDYGSGEEGDVAIAVDTVISTTLYYDHLTINVGKKVTPGFGFNPVVLIAKTSIAVNGPVSSDGAPGQSAIGGGSQNGGIGGGTGGGAQASRGVGSFGGSGSNGSVGGSASPGNPPVGNSALPLGLTIVRGAGAGFPPNLNGAAGGAGGDEGGGQGGTSTASPGGITNYLPFEAWLGEIISQLQLLQALLVGGGIFPSGGNGGVGGGGGGRAGGSPAGGGGGGQGGGIVFLAAPVVTISSTGIVRAQGGAGGAGGTMTGGNHGAGGGGGAGGNGGLVIVICETLVNDGILAAPGGSGGAAGLHNVTGTDGQPGNTGNPGNVWWFRPSTGVWTAL